MNHSAKKSDYIREANHHLMKEKNHDPYHSKNKLKEPTVCPVCSAVYHKGRWLWGRIPEDAHKTVCPACHRIHDKVPAGFLTISGDFYQQHKVEISSLIRNLEEQEKNKHPLKRVMGIEDIDNKTIFTFTDAHLTREVGDALHHAYQGELDYQYTDEDIMLRVNWKR